MKKLKNLLAALGVTSLLLGGFHLAAPATAQTLSDQVLLLLDRANNWSALQTFTDLTITGTCTGCGGAGGGTVTSVASTVDTELDTIVSLSGSPIVGSGTLAFTLDSQSANIVLAGPSTGAATDPTFRALVDDDIPDTITIAGTNNVTWASVNKTGSDSADLATFDVDDVTGGTLALANITDGATAGVPLVAGGAGGDPSYTALDLTSATSISGELAAANVPTFAGGDVTSAGGSLVLTLANTAVTAASYGSGTQIPSFTVDAKGRLTAASNNAITTAALLSTSFCSDCTASTPTRGDLMYVPVGGSWDDLAIGAAGTALLSDGTDLAWGVDGTGLNIDVDNATAGDLALNRGGTAASLTAAAGGAVYSTASALAITAAGTTGECLISQGASAPIWSTCATAAAHDLLSATHTDTLASAVSRGSIIYGNSTPAYAELAIGSNGTFLRSDGTDISWSSDGSLITLLNASNLSSGTVPLGRITGLTDTNVSASAGIQLSKLDTSSTSSEFFAILTDEAARSGGVVPQFVDWTDVVYNAGDFTAGGSQTWTVDSGDVDLFTYTVTGNKMTVAFDIADTTVGGTPHPQLLLAIPGGYTVATTTGGGGWIFPIWVTDAGGTPQQGVASIPSAGTDILLFVDVTIATNWAAATNTTRVAGQVTFEIE